MSMDDPNPYEQAIEAYAEAVREENDSKKALDEAREKYERAMQNRQDLWSPVKSLAIEGKIKTGIYRLREGRTEHADGLLIEPHSDFPELFPMFR